MSRVQLALNVDDLAESIAFYTKLFATEAGFASIDERGTTCCYAKQDKFWVEGAPNGERWEIYTVLADSVTAGGPSEGSDCSCDTATAGINEPAVAGCC